MWVSEDEDKPGRISSAIHIVMSLTVSRLQTLHNATQFTRFLRYLSPRPPNKSYLILKHLKAATISRETRHLYKKRFWLSIEIISKVTRLLRSFFEVFVRRINVILSDLPGTTSAKDHPNVLFIMLFFNDMINLTDQIMLIRLSYRVTKLS